jgi:hypothetical protein
MNPITFKKRFEEIYGFIKKQNPKLENSPLFHHVDSAEMWYKVEENKYARDANNLPIFPYQNFRAQLTSTDHAGEITSTTNLLVSETHPILPPSHFKDDPRFELGPNSRILTIFAKIEKVMENGIDITRKDEKLLIFQVTPTKQKTETLAYNSMLAWLYSETKGLTPIPIKLHPNVSWRMEYYLELLEKFSIDVLHPNNLIAKRCPNNKNKSVEWLKNREHYVILNKRHPANKKGASGKIECSEEKIIKQISHARRAHYRLLKSERFKSKKGSHVFVKATWVGPTQWEDGSGSIYKIEK